MMLEGARCGATPFFLKSDTVVVDPGAHCALIAKENSPLARRFQTKYPQKPQTVPASGMMEFFRWLES